MTSKRRRGASASVVTYPTIVGTPALTASGTGVNNTNATLTLNLPTGIVSGELLVLLVSTASARTVTQPSGWAMPLALNPGGSGTERQLCVMTKTATGSEGSTVSASQSVNSNYSSVAVRIDDWSNIEVSTGTTGNSATPNPDSISPSWGASVGSLFLAAGSLRGGIASAGPSGYTGLTAGESGNVSIAVANRSAASANEDPSAFTTPTSNTWAAATIAIS